ncbi:MAG: class I SAM-dependent methyltransferase [Candidatus Omnitrophota bacterium]
MANFPPLKNYLIYCLDKLIDDYQLSYPFLDVGCGAGDVSSHLALKGWQGEAIDLSDQAIEDAKSNLALFNNIKVVKSSLFEVNGKFKTVFLLDVLEHINDDRAALTKIASLLAINGFLVISLPSNPREWRWDDDFYGHYRRYSLEGIKEKLILAGLKPLIFWDFTYPVFCFIRRLYTKLKSFENKTIEQDKLKRSIASSAVNAWDIPLCSKFLSRESFFWSFIYRLQFKFFRDKVKNGHEMLVLAQKSTE